MSLNIQQLKEVLNSREKSIFPHEFKNSPMLERLPRAGVLIILLPTKSDEFGYSILFNQRSNNVPNHKGQISFPGGGFKDEDITLANTALRETYEETGLKIKHTDILGTIDKYITISNFLVTPFVATGPEEPRKLKPDGWEIIESFEIPLSILLDETNYAVEQREYLGRIFDIHYYHYEDRRVWGVTGEILFHFLKIVKEILSL